MLLIRKRLAALDPNTPHNLDSETGDRRLEYIFNVYDLNGDGYLSSDGGEEILFSCVVAVVFVVLDSVLVRVYLSSRARYCRILVRILSFICLV